MMLNVESIDGNKISILGKIYYIEDYAKALMRREYERGKLEGDKTKNIIETLNHLKYKIYDGTILEVGKKYRWSGTSEGLYTSYSWKNDKCKIIKIENDTITIYDYSDNKELDYTDEQLTKNRITFKKLNYLSL